MQLLFRVTTLRIILAAFALAVPAEPSTVVSGRRACRDGMKRTLGSIERMQLHITSAKPKAHPKTTETDNADQPAMSTHQSKSKRGLKYDCTHQHIAKSLKCEQSMKTIQFVSTFFDNKSSSTESLELLGGGRAWVRCVFRKRMKVEKHNQNDRSAWFSTLNSNSRSTIMRNSLKRSNFRILDEKSKCSAENLSKLCFGTRVSDHPGQKFQDAQVERT